MVRKKKRWILIALIVGLLIQVLVWMVLLRNAQLRERTLGVDVAPVGELFDPAKMPNDWKVVQTHSLSINGKTYRLYHYEEPKFMIPEEHGIVIDSRGIISEVIRGDDELHLRVRQWEEQGLLKR